MGLLLGAHLCVGLVACSSPKDTSSRSADDDDGGKKKKKRKKKKKPEKPKEEEVEETPSDADDEKERPETGVAWKVGDAVDVEWKGSWWKATILTVESDANYKIHYVGWSASWDEVVPAHRVRARSSTAREGHEKEPSGASQPGGSNARK